MLGAARMGVWASWRAARKRCRGSASQRNGEDGRWERAAWRWPKHDVDGRRWPRQSSAAPVQRWSRPVLGVELADAVPEHDAARAKKRRPMLRGWTRDDGLMLWPLRVTRSAGGDGTKSSSVEVWRSMLQRKGLPVVLERPQRGGETVLASSGWQWLG